MPAGARRATLVQRTCNYAVKTQGQIVKRLVRQSIEPAHCLEVDHTVVDCMLITDVYTRCVIGFDLKLRRTTRGRP